MAQRIFAGMLNETLTILTVRYCQTNTTEATTRLLLNDILNILLCVAQLLPSICTNGSDLAGLDVKHQTRDVRDIHAKCNELFKCFVYRGSELHFIHQAFKEKETNMFTKECPYPWFTFVSPKMFDNFDDRSIKSTQDLCNKTALGLELTVLLAQPQPSWALIVKVLMMRDCHLARILLIRAIQHMCVDNSRWPADGLWFSVHDRQKKCDGFLCTADGFCLFKRNCNDGEEFARAAGALAYILATIGSKAELKSTLCYALEISGRDWASCLDKRQVWCDRRPPWLAGILAIAGSVLQFMPPILINAIQSGASMYQTMSLCLTCISRSLDCVPRSFKNACSILQNSLPLYVNPVGGSVFLQMLVTIAYEEILKWSKIEVEKEKTVASSANGSALTMHTKSSRAKPKQVRIVALDQTTTSTSISFDGSSSSPSCIALAIAEALCSIDEDDKHTLEIEQLIALSNRKVVLSNQFGLEDFPEFAELFEEGDVPGSNAERASDAAALTSQILMSPPGRDSLRVMFEHLQLHAEWIFKELGIHEPCDIDIPLDKAPLVYTMFHIGKQSFDQFLRGEWAIPWSKLVSVAKAWSGIEGAKVHINRRTDVKTMKRQGKCSKQLIELNAIFKSNPEGLL